MILAAAWYSADHYGVFVPGGHSWQKPSPAPSATAEILAIIGRSVKYYGRTTTEGRAGLCAASVVLREMCWGEPGVREIGLLSSSPDGCLCDNREYFRDYVASGRTLGRGNLFVYTLPTSVAGEIAIALSLTGPCFFLLDDARPLESLVRQAERILADGEADGMLALWSDPHAALCMAVDKEVGNGENPALLAISQSNPLQLVREFQAMVERA